jgi:hypothetical protein
MKSPPATPPPNRPIAWCRSDDYQKSSEKLQSFSGWTEPHCGLDMPLYAAPQIAVPIRDWSNLAAMVDRAERLLNMSCWKRASTNPCPDVTDIIDICFALRSLVNDIRSEVAQ